MFFKVNNMTTSVPDSFSPEELQRLLAEAQPEPEVTADPDKQSQEYICDIAQEAIDLACEKSSGPLVHKVMLHHIIGHMFEWHTKMAEEFIEEGNYGCAIGWSRDAGKFQAIMNILSTISVDKDDFTCTAQ